MSTKKPMTLSQALRDWQSQDETRREEARDKIRTSIGNLAVIAMAGGQVDVDQTVENLAFAKEHGAAKLAGCITVVDLFASARAQTEADPIDGSPLLKGRTVTRQPVVDWTPVTMDQRKVVAYAAERGEIRPGDSEDAADEIQRPAAVQSVAWKRRTREWEALLAKPRKTPAEQALIARVEARLYVQETPPFVEAPPVPVQASGVHISGSVTGSVIVQGNGNTFREPCEADRPGGGCPGYRGACGRPGQMGQCGRVILGAPPKGKRLFVIASHSEADFLVGIDKQFYFAKKDGLRISSTLAIPGGVVVAKWIAEEMRQANVIAVLVSAECAAQHGDAIAGATMLWRQGSARVIPILARPFDDVALQGLVFLPRGGKPISSYQDKDTVYCEIAGELKPFLR